METALAVSQAKYWHLKQISVFRSLADWELKQLVNVADLRLIKAGTPLFHADEAALHLFVSYLDFSQMQTAIEMFRSSPSYDTFWNYFKDVPLDRLNPEFREAVNSMGNAIQEGNKSVVPEAANAMEQYLNFKMDIPMVGASGAIFGLLLGFGIKFPNAELMLIFLPIPIKAKYFIPLLMLVELYLGVNNFSWDNIAHFAHLGGALIGLLLILFGRYVNLEY